MNKLLSRAIEEVSSLPEDAQEAIAASILEQVEAERGWSERFARTPDTLANLARQARKRIEDGHTYPIS